MSGKTAALLQAVRGFLESPVAGPVAIVHSRAVGKSLAFGANYGPVGRLTRVRNTLEFERLFGSINGIDPSSSLPFPRSVGTPILPSLMARQLARSLRRCGVDATVHGRDNDLDKVDAKKDQRWRQGTAAVVSRSDIGDLVVRSLSICEEAYGTQWPRASGRWRRALRRLETFLLNPEHVEAIGAAYALGGRSALIRLLEGAT